MFAAGNWFAVVLILTAALLGGCAWTSNGVRPVMAMDGEPIDMQDPIGNARALLVTGQYGLAIDALSRLVQEDPRNHRARALLAVAYDHLKRYDLADRYYSEALQIDPSSIAALNNWGYSYLVRGDKARARGLLERAAALNRDQPIVAANLGLVNGETPGAATRQPRDAQAVETARSIRLSEHVTLLRRSGRLVRMAPGVQLLVTDSGQIEESSSVQMHPAAAPAETVMDSRFELFRQLFSMMEQPKAGVSSETTQQSPFARFAEVDDFSAL